MGILHYKDPTTGQWVPLSAAGPTGAQGAVGPVGPAGPKGDPGTPLDEVWVGPEAPTGSSVEVWVDTDEVGSNDVLTRQVADATYVNVAGDTMTGPLVITSSDPNALRVNFNGKEIAFAARDDVGQSGTPAVGAIVRMDPFGYAQLIVADPVQITHAANKKYVDNLLAIQQVESTSVSWNSLVTAGTHRRLMHGVDNANGPGRSIYYYVTVYQYGAQATQVAYPYGSYTASVPAIMLRTLYGGSWSKWVPAGGGDYVTWTPTVTGCTTSSVVARYARNGNTVHFRVVLTLSAAPTGDVSVTLPPNLDVAPTSPEALTLYLVDVSDSARYLGGGFLENGKIYCRRVRTASADAHILSTLNATMPFAWASGDRIYVSGTYETNAA